VARYILDGERTITVASVIEEIEKAQDEISAICHGKRWRMCVPVDDGESDIVIGDALRHAKILIQRLQGSTT